MKTKKKIYIIAIASLIAIIAGGIIGYFGYGSTMLNTKSEESIVNHLSDENGVPVEILKTIEHKNLFAVLYTQPNKNDSSVDVACMKLYEKHKYYKNRYIDKGTSGGEQNEAAILFQDIANTDPRILFIANAKSEQTQCSVFEFNLETLHYENRLEVIDVPQNQPYIIVREYELKNKKNIVVAFDGDVSLDDLNMEY